MKILFTLLFTSLFIFSSFAQEPIDEKEEEVNSVEIITFGNDEKEKHNVNLDYKDMIIKTSPTAFIVGTIPFELEKELTDYFSVQVGLGLTYFSPIPYDQWRNLFWEEGGESYCESKQWEGRDFCDDPTDLEYRKNKIGFLASFSGRFFLNQEGFDGSYLAPIVRYSTRRSKVQMIDESFGSYDMRLLNSYDNEIDKNIDFAIHYGNQLVSKKFTWEYFVGLGIRQQTRLFQDLGYDSNQNLRNGALHEVIEYNFLYEGGLRVGFRL